MPLVHTTEDSLVIEFINRGIDFDTDMLGIGDVIISERTGIEIKRGSYNNGIYQHDFVASIKDGRFHTQMQNLSEAFERGILIIEGYQYLFEDKSVDEKSIKSCLVEASVRWGISILPTRDIDETVYMILKAVEYDAKEGYHTPVNIHPKPKSLRDEQIYLLSGLYRTGIKNAKILLDFFGTPSGVFKAIDNAEFIIPKRGKRKKLVGDLAKIKGFGKKFVEGNQRLLTESAKQTK